jgi:hypothetical protein
MLHSVEQAYLKVAAEGGNDGRRVTIGFPFDNLPPRLEPAGKFDVEKLSGRLHQA